MTHLEIVKKLVGNIEPVGATHIDDNVFENLKVMCELVNDLVIEIDRVAYANKNRQEYSMRKIGEYASDFLTKTIGIQE